MQNKYKQIHAMTVSPPAYGTEGNELSNRLHISHEIYNQHNSPDTGNPITDAIITRNCIKT